jgi:hypothetical protein
MSLTPSSRERELRSRRAVRLIAFRLRGNVGAALGALLLLLTGCQEQPVEPLMNSRMLSECQAGQREGCRVASHARYRVRHSVHTVAASQQSTPTQRDVDAILEGMQRAKESTRIPPTESNPGP